MFIKSALPRPRNRLAATLLQDILSNTKTTTKTTTMSITTTTTTTTIMSTLVRPKETHTSEQGAFYVSKRTSRKSSISVSSNTQLHEEEQIWKRKNKLHRKDPLLLLAPPPNPQPALLLLECSDELWVSDTGVARSLYRLRPNHATACDERAMGTTHMVVEELYHLPTATKSFVLRRHDIVTEKNNDRTIESCSPGRNGFSIRPKSADAMVSLGKPLVSLEHLQEIQTDTTTRENHCWWKDAGTGATTWESSLAMALYFHQQQQQQVQQGQSADTVTSTSAKFLHGKVLEVGCGVGIGSILTHWGSGWARAMTVPSSSSSSIASAVESITLTDGNDKVLEQCRQNLQTAHQNRNHSIQSFLTSYGEAGHGGFRLPPIHVEKLDWNDFVQNLSKIKEGDENKEEIEEERRQPLEDSNHDDSMRISANVPFHTNSTRTTKNVAAQQSMPQPLPHQRQRPGEYDTVLACDCAYLTRDVPILAKLLTTLVSKKRRQTGGGTIHLFGPYNRAALQQLTCHLQRDSEFHVEQELLELDRYRLKPGSATNVSGPQYTNQPGTWERNAVEHAEVASHSVATFLHVTARYKNSEEDRPSSPSNPSMTDID